MDLPAVQTYLQELQSRICDELSAIDGSATFDTESWDRPEGGGGITRVLSEGAVFEKAGELLLCRGWQDAGFGDTASP